MNRRSFLNAALAVSSLPFIEAKCSSQDAIALLDGIVAAGDILLASPAVLNMPNAVEWVNQGLTITTNLIEGGITTATISTAIAQYAALVAQITGSGDTQAALAIGAFIQAIQAFLTAWQDGNVTLPAMTAKDLQKLQAISGRAHALLNKAGVH